MSCKAKRTLLPLPVRSGGRRYLVFILVSVIVFAAGPSAFAGQLQADVENAGVQNTKAGEVASGTAGRGASKLSHFRVFRLKNISAAEAAEYLSQLQIGTASPLPGDQMLLVTAEPGQLNRAGAVLKLVDSKVSFVIKELSHLVSPEDLPSPQAIETQLGGVAIGTFDNPPDELARPAAIIGVIRGRPVVLAPEGLVERIISAVDAVRASRPRPAGKQPLPADKSLPQGNALAAPVEVNFPQEADATKVSVTQDKEKGLPGEPAGAED